LPDTAPRDVVALALDDRMVYGFVVLTHSLVTRSHKDAYFLVGFFDGQLSNRNQILIKNYLDWLGWDYELRQLEPDDLFTERRHLTMTTFSKFILADYFTEAHLWLDIDTIALDGWDAIFTSLHAAADDVSLVVADKIESPHTRFDGFNAGVLGWTTRKREEWLSALASLPEKRFSSEQYLFNELYKDGIQRVPASFNFLSSWHKESSAEKPAFIIHYSGPLKPWHLARRHAPAWRAINQLWEKWFDAEAEMLSTVADTPFAKDINQEKRRALFSARLYLGKGSLPSWVMRALAVLGPLGDPVVALISRRSS